MNNFKKETMNANLKTILESDLQKKYEEEKNKVF